MCKAGGVIKSQVSSVDTPPPLFLSSPPLHTPPDGMDIDASHHDTHNNNNNDLPPSPSKRSRGGGGGGSGGGANGKRLRRLKIRYATTSRAQVRKGFVCQCVYM